MFTIMKGIGNTITLSITFDFVTSVYAILAQFKLSSKEQSSDETNEHCFLTARLISIVGRFSPN